MQDFTLWTPTKVFFGKGALRVGEIVQDYGFRKPLLYFGGGSAERSGLLGRIRSSLREVGIGWAELGGVQANPTTDFCEETVRFIREKHCDLILAIGGGSVIDSAKMASHCVFTGHSPWDYTTGQAVPEHDLPVGVVLTIAASGSETSNSAVLTNPELGVKRGLSSDANRPLFAILDPELTYALPPFQTACGVTDILMHTMERYLCFNPDNDLIDSMAEGLCRSVIAAGRTVKEQPRSYEARATLMLAGSLSHNGLTGAGRDYKMVAHALSHELSAYDDSIAHGAGLAVLWPNYLGWLLDNGLAVGRLTRMARNVWDCADAADGIRACRDYFNFLGMPARFADLGLNESNIPYLAQHCTANDTQPVRSYRPLGRLEVEAIYCRCL